MIDDDIYNPDPRAHPGLHIIAIIAAAKGVLALIAASGLELLGPAPLRRGIDALIAYLHLDPQVGAMAWLAKTINPQSVHIAAIAVFAYGLLYLFEGWGLWRAKAWASWLGCVTAALYLPFDGYALIHHAHWLSAGVVAVNLLVVWVLGRDLLVRRH